jgi:hypothetical protein
MVPPKKAIGPSNEQRKYRVCLSQRNSFRKILWQVKSIVIDKSAVGFKCKITFKIYNPKKKKNNEGEHQIICIS